jgi:hypothetical protein
MDLNPVTLIGFALIIIIAYCVLQALLPYAVLLLIGVCCFCVFANKQ